MRDLLLAAVESQGGPLSLAFLKKKSPFKNAPDELERIVRELVREGTLIRIKTSKNRAEKIELASRVPPPENQILQAIGELSQKTGSVSVSKVLSKVIGASETVARAALQNLVQQLRIVRTQGTKKGEEFVYLAGAAPTEDRLVSALKQLREQGGYPATIAQLRQASGMKELNLKTLQDAMKAARLPLLIHSEGKEIRVLLEEDIFAFVNLRDVLARLKTTSPSKYPASFTEIMKGLKGLKLPLGWKCKVEALLKTAGPQSISGIRVITQNIRKKQERRYGLAEDEELLKLLTLKLNELRLRVITLWQETQALKQQNELLQHRLIELTSSQSISVQSRPKTTKVKKRVATGSEPISSLEPTVQDHERVFQTIRMLSAANVFRIARISELRAHLPEMSKEFLDKVLISLSRKRRINLLFVNDPSTLEPGEEPLLLETDGKRFYGISVRKEGKKYD